MSMGTMSGTCLCGSVKITVTDQDHDHDVGVCHCRTCQRWTGSAFVAFFARAAGVSVEGPVTRYASSSFGERAFCGTCGTNLWFRGTGNSDAVYELTPGFFDGAAGYPLSGEIYADRALAAVRLVGDHQRTSRADYEANNLHV